MNQIKNIDSKTLNNWLNENTVVLIDVREPLEYRIERIKDAKNIPLSTICFEDINLPKNKNKKIVIQCRSGSRSRAACEKILKHDSIVD